MGCVISDRIHNYNDKSLRVISNLERYIVIYPGLYHDDALLYFLTRFENEFSRSGWLMNRK